MTKNSLPEPKYPLLLRTIHWLMAALIIVNLILGSYMEPYQDDKPIWDNYYFIHKSFGVLLLILIVIRLSSRLTMDLPPLPSSLPKFDRTLAKLSHKLLYILMFIVPIMGYFHSSTYEYSSGVPFFGLFDIPELLEKNESLAEFFDWAHRTAAYTLACLIILHVAGAIKHRFFDSDKRNDVLKRIL